MKKHLFLLISIITLSFYCVFAQTNCVPDMLHLTAVARDASGNPITVPVNVKVTFAQGSASGTIIYCETSTTNTNSFGEFSFNVGDPANTLCTPYAALNTLPWSSCAIFYNIYYSTTLTFPSSPNASGQFTTSPFSFASRSAEKLTTAATSVGQVLTWNGTDWIAQALPNMAGAGQNRIGFSSSSSWTCPLGVTSITVECWGAGGGSGSCDTCFTGGCYPIAGSGGKGGYNKQIISVIPGNNYTITIGNGGSAGIFRTSTNGQSGGSTSFNGVVIALGGIGGTNAHCNGCNSQPGINGNDGPVTNYNWPISAIPSSRSYIQQTYLTNINYPSALANGGGATYWQFYGIMGEDGFMVITY